jgi:SGNH hydrolase-like domain, acetyltransferase AlgX
VTARERARSRFVVSAVLAAASFAVALGVGEIALRVAYRSPPGLHFSVRAPTYRPDPDLAYSLRPGAELVWKTSEFTERDSINSDGFRAPSGGAAASNRLILAVGDSFTFGHGVRMRESYPKVVQEMLRSNGWSVRVVNAGVPGYGMDQTFKFMSRRGAAMHPDVVLVGVQCSDLFDAFDVPLYDVQDGRLVELDASRTYPYMQGRLAKRVPRFVSRTYTFGLLLGVLRHDPFAQRPHLTTSVEDWARQKILYEVLELFHRGTAGNFAVVALLMPCPERLESQAGDPYGSLASELGTASVPVLDTLPEMQRVNPDARSLFYAVDRHLTPEGNRLLATVVSSFIERRALLDR